MSKPKALQKIHSLSFNYTLKESTLTLQQDTAVFVPGAKDRQLLQRLISPHRSSAVAAAMFEGLSLETDSDGCSSNC